MICTQGSSRKEKTIKKALAVGILIEKARLGHELPFCTSIEIHANTVSLQVLCEIRTTITRFSLCVCGVSVLGIEISYRFDSQAGHARRKVFDLLKHFWVGGPLVGALFIVFPFSFLSFDRFCFFVNLYHLPLTDRILVLVLLHNIPVVTNLLGYVKWMQVKTRQKERKGGGNHCPHDTYRRMSLSV